MTNTKSKRDEIDAISTREMNKRYGDKNVNMIATKAMKEDNIQEILDKGCTTR